MYVEIKHCCCCLFDMEVDKIDTRPRAQSHAGTPAQSDGKQLRNVSRPRSQTSIDVFTEPNNETRQTLLARGRSFSDPSNGISKIINLGRGYLAILASLSRATPDVYSMRGDFRAVPTINVAPLSNHVLSAYSGPQGGLTNIVETERGKVEDISERNLRERINSVSSENESVITKDKEVGHQPSHNASNSNGKHNDDTVASRIDKWNLRKDWAYGIVVSLYEFMSDNTQECTGDPVADVIAIKTTQNSAILAVADGCGWGYGSRRAARCAIKGCMDYIGSHLYSQGGEESAITNTEQIFQIMRDSIDEGQRLILMTSATLTTLVLSVVTQRANSTDFVVCTMNVGDSLAYVFSEEYGVRELTKGCRCMKSHRNIRFCDGALGPAMGDSPDLTNLTFSISVVKKGDVVFLTSDGVSDNFDPVVAGIAEASLEYNRRDSVFDSVHKGRMKSTSDDFESCDKPVYSPIERQKQTEYQMEEVLKKTDIPNESLQSAQAVCSKLLQHAIVCTETKRKAHLSVNNILLERTKNPMHRTVLDIPDTTADGMRRFLRTQPGKLDHGSVVAYVVGLYGTEEKEEAETEQDTVERKEVEKEMEQRIDESIESKEEN